MSRSPTRDRGAAQDQRRRSAADSRVEACLLTVGDGVMLVRVKG